MSHPILYSFRRCPYAIRARLAILASGLICELREVDLSNKPVALRRVSPKATVPVLVLPSGDVLEQSVDIMSFALKCHDPDNWLRLDDEHATSLVARNDNEFKFHLDHYKYPNRHQGDALEHRSAGLAILSDLDVRLAQNGCLTGPHYSLIDIAILPFVRQFAAVNEVWFADQNIKHVQNWLADFLISDSFHKAMTPCPVWQEGHEITLLPR